MSLRQNEAAVAVEAAARLLNSGPALPANAASGMRMKATVIHGRARLMSSPRSSRQPPSSRRRCFARHRGHAARRSQRCRVGRVAALLWGPSYKVEDQRRIDPADVDAYLAGRREDAA